MFSSVSFRQFKITFERSVMFVFRMFARKHVSG